MTTERNKRALLTLAALVGVVAFLLLFLGQDAAAEDIIGIRQFGTSAGDVGQDVAVDAAGNAYVVGNTGGTLPGQTSAGGQDAYVRKYDPAGNEGWTRQFGTSADEGGPG